MGEEWGSGHEEGRALGSSRRVVCVEGVRVCGARPKYSHPGPQPETSYLSSYAKPGPIDTIRLEISELIYTNKIHLSVRTFALHTSTSSRDRASLLRQIS